MRGSEVGGSTKSPEYRSKELVCRQFRFGGVKVPERQKRAGKRGVGVAWQADITFHRFNSTT